MGRKIALVIGNGQYDDAGLARLGTADVDVRELAGVLRAREVGQFDSVTEVANQSVAVVRRSIAHFFSDAKRDDLLLLYFSGHGVKDEQGNLYLAVKDTERPLLAGTSIEAAFITAQMDRSHSKRQILILDCCHSGAFSYGAKAGAGGVMGTGPAFEGNGYGRVVLTALHMYVVSGFSRTVTGPPEGGHYVQMKRAVGLAPSTRKSQTSYFATSNCSSDSTISRSA